MMNRHDETEDLFNEYMRNQEGVEDNYMYYEDEDGAVVDNDNDVKIGKQNSIQDIVNHGDSLN